MSRDTPWSTTRVTKLKLYNSKKNDNTELERYQVVQILIVAILRFLSVSIAEK